MRHAAACTVTVLALGAGTGAAAQSFAAPDGFSQRLISETYDRIEPALCLLEYSVEITNPNSGEVSVREANGLGVVVSPDGLVMSQGHIQIENRHPCNIKVTFPDEKRQRDAVLLSKPEDVNLAFLRIENGSGETFPCVSFDRDVELGLGEPVLVLGLLKETLDHKRAIQMYRVSAILDEPRRTYALDGAVPYGFAGGPVVTRDGRVAGVAGFDLAAAEGGDLYTRSGHPLVFQTALFKSYIESPPGEADETGADDAWLGVFTQPLTDDLAEYWGLPEEGGVVVSTVIQGSPADRAGLRMGDVIVSFNGRPIEAKQDLDVLAFTRMVRESPLGEPLPIHLLREGEPVDMQLTLLPRPKSGRDAEAFEDDVLGVTVRELTTDVRIVMNLPDEIGGVLVRRVKSGSPAALAGIRPGFVILAIGQRVTTALGEYREAIEAEASERHPEVIVFCRIGASTAFFRIEPRWQQP
jgi:serine protease Do